MWIVPSRHGYEAATHEAKAEAEALAMLVPESNRFDLFISCNITFILETSNVLLLPLFKMVLYCLALYLCVRFDLYRSEKP